MSTNDMTTLRAILIQGTHGADNAEKATLPFIVGNVSATADQDTVVFLTSDAVWLATRGYADDITFADHPPAGKFSPTSSPTAAASGPAVPAPDPEASPPTTSSTAPPS
jgi:hypothetical protein